MSYLPMAFSTSPSSVTSFSVYRSGSMFLFSYFITLTSKATIFGAADDGPASDAEARSLSRVNEGHARSFPEFPAGQACRLAGGGRHTMRTSPRPVDAPVIPLLRARPGCPGGRRGGTDAVDVVGGKRLWSSKDRPAAVGGGLVAVRAHEGKKCRFLALDTGKPADVPQPNATGVFEAAFSADGSRCAAKADDRIAVRSVATGKALCEVPATTGRFALAPDGSKPATLDGAIDVSDAATGQPLLADPHAGRAGDCPAGWRAIRGLASPTGVDVLKRARRCEPMPAAEAAECLAKLDAREFKVREAALRIRRGVSPAPRAALAKTPSAEVNRRVEDSHAGLGTDKPAAGEAVRVLRAIVALSGSVPGSAADAR